jgi:NOL1/NOP2/fmu family ribosome biogenesis protein
MNQKILNSKEKKEIYLLLNSQFGYKKSKEYHVLQKENDIFFFDGDSDDINFDNLRIVQIGIKIGEIRKEQIILTIHGSQIIGPDSDKNIITLSKEDARNYLRGEELNIDIFDGVYLLKSEDEFIGCGIIKSGIVSNTIERARVINSKD